MEDNERADVIQNITPLFQEQYFYSSSLSCKTCPGNKAKTGSLEKLYWKQCIKDKNKADS